MNTFEYVDKIWDVFTNDEILIELLGVDTENEADYENKFRLQDRAAEEFEADGLNYIAFYFFDADTSKNYLLNYGNLRIDIYATMRDEVTDIRARIVQLMHERFDAYIKAEGQRSSGIKNVYKYRLEFTPMVFT